MRQPSLVHPRKFATKFGAITGVFVLVGGLFVWNVAEHATPSAAAAAPACTTSNLDVWLNTMGNGAAGSSYYNLNFTNLSAHSCTLYGYPGISAITQTGIQLGSSAGRNAEHAPAHITLTSARTARGFETSTAHNTAAAVQAGFVWINEVSKHFLGAPFGGYKQSGIGREECIEELFSFTREKNIHLNLRRRSGGH